jgi:hypothetical protein
MSCAGFHDVSSTTAYLPSATLVLLKVLALGESYVFVSLEKQKSMTMTIHAS